MDATSSGTAHPDPDKPSLIRMVPHPLDDVLDPAEATTYARAYEFQIPERLLDVDVQAFADLDQVHTVGYTQRVGYAPDVHSYIKVYPVGLEFVVNPGVELIDWTHNKLKVLGIDINKEQIVLSRSKRSVGLHTDINITCILAVPIKNADKGQVWFASPDKVVRTRFTMKPGSLYLLNVSQYHGLVQDPDCDDYWFLRIFFGGRTFLQVANILQDTLGPPVQL